MDPPALTKFSGYGAENVAGRPFGDPVEDGHQSRTGVLGVDIDRSRAESLERNLRSAEPKAALHRETPALQKLGEHLGQEKGFSKRLRGHDDRGTLSPRDPWAQGQRQAEPEAGEAGGPSPEDP